jgi:hypothetical protein
LQTYWDSLLAACESLPYFFLSWIVEICGDFGIFWVCSYHAL